MRRLPELSLYLVLDPVLCGNEKGMLQTAIEAAKAGVGCVQLRAPGWSTGRLSALGKRLKASLAPYGTALVVNNDIVATMLCEADGVHLGQDDASPTLARSILGENVIIGLSITCPEELSSLDPTVVDYAGIGPVFATMTKPDAAPAMGLATFEHVARLCPVPCVAIGGISQATIGTFRKRGAAGVAVVSAICGKPEVGEAARKLKALFLEADPLS